MQPATLPEPRVLPERRRATGGTLRVHLDSEPAHLHPLLDTDSTIGSVVQWLVYEPLIECRGDEYVPALAERWEVSPDELKITLHLRPGVRWHDNRAFGVLDVQATLEPLLRAAPEVPLLRSDLSDIVSMEIAADRIVRLKLRRPSDLALRALCDVPILPDHLIRGWSPERSPITRQPVGTGPFRFLAWDRGKRIRLGRAPESRGFTPALEEIHFEIDLDAARALTRIRRGEIDVLPRVAEVHYPDQVEPATLRGSLTLYHLQPQRTSFLVVNQRRPPLDDASFRRALAMLWDRERFAAEAHRGLARPIGAPPFGAAMPAPFNRAGAITLLESAGYRDTDGDGVRDRDRRPIRLTMVQTTGARGLAVETRAYVLELRKAGILLDLATAEPAALLARMRAGTFDLAPLMWEGRRDEDPSILFGAAGANNFGGHQSPTIESLLGDLRRARGSAARRPILGRIADTLSAELPVIFLYRHDIAAVISNRVHGLAATGDRLDFRGVWLDP